MLRNKTELYSHDNMLFREMGSFTNTTIIPQYSLFGVFGALFLPTSFFLMLRGHTFLYEFLK